MSKTIPLLTDRAYERIRHDIIACGFLPGTGISETQTGDQKSTSRFLDANKAFHVAIAQLTSSSVMNLALGVEGPG